VSGETEASVSGWTTDTLHQHLSRRMDDLDRALSRRMDDADKAIQAALVSAEKAVGKAEAASERRFEGVNEFRQTLSDQAATFPTRGEVAAQIERVNAEATRNTARLGELELRLTSRLDQGEGADKGASSFRSEHRLDVSTGLTAASVLLGFLVLAIALYSALHH